MMEQALNRRWLVHITFTRLTRLEIAGLLKTLRLLGHRGNLSAPDQAFSDDLHKGWYVTQG